MKIDLALLGLLGYVIPAITARFALELLGHDLSHESNNAILGSAAFATIGYAVGWIATLRKKRSSLSTAVPKGKNFRIHASRILLTIGIVSIAVNFFVIGSIPLLSNNDSRVTLQNSVLWNIYILCSIGLLIYSVAIKDENDKLGKLLAFTYILSALLTAWKGTLLIFILLYLTPKLKNALISPIKLIGGFALFIAVFIFINGLRGSGFVNALIHPVYYAYWGFANFDAEAVNTMSDCIHSIPMIGCKFQVDNEQLINPAFNVFTALSPLFIDGGALLVSFTFFTFGFLLKYFQRTASSPINDYIFYVAFYFMLFASNGYIFYSSFYFNALALLLVIEIAITGHLKHKAMLGKYRHDN